MSKMDLTQFSKACAALASAWNDVTKDGVVFALGSEDSGLYAQMSWEDFRELFPSELISFSQRGLVEQEDYPWEAQAFIENVKVIALLTDEQFQVASSTPDPIDRATPEDKEAE